MKKENQLFYSVIFNQLLNLVDEIEKTYPNEDKNITSYKFNTKKDLKNPFELYINLDKIARNYLKFVLINDPENYEKFKNRKKVLDKLFVNELKQEKKLKKYLFEFETNNILYPDEEKEFEDLNVLI